MGLAFLTKDTLSAHATPMIWGWNVDAS
ncbi:unnamed protein product [Ectocarpus sp. CCAP 1310/34]|nr:unnamed protein product [Ectocarpus sp. CCAP 1310/34]